MQEVEEITLLGNVQLNTVPLVDLHEEVVCHKGLIIAILPLDGGLTFVQVLVRSHAFVTETIQLLRQNLVCPQNCC